MVITINSMNLSTPSGWTRCQSINYSIAPTLNLPVRIYNTPGWRKASLTCDSQDKRLVQEHNTVIPPGGTSDIKGTGVLVVPY